MRGGLEFWSNAAYLVAGIVMLLVGHQLAGLALIFLAVASGLFHQTGKLWARRLDRYGILLVILGTAAEVGAIPLWVVLPLGVLSAVVVRKPVDLYIALGCGFLMGYRWPASIIAGLLFLGAVLFGRWGERYQYSVQEALKYDVLHSIWHVLTAAAVVTYLLV